MPPWRSFLLQGVAARAPALVFSLNTERGTVRRAKDRGRTRCDGLMAVPASVFWRKTEAGTRAATPWSTNTTTPRRHLGPFRGRMRNQRLAQNEPCDAPRSRPTFRKAGMKPHPENAGSQGQFCWVGNPGSLCVDRGKKFSAN